MGVGSQTEEYDEKSSDNSAPFSPGYTSYAMSLLLVIYILNYLDRQVVNILAEPIKQDLQLADWQLGLMSGLAFAVLYTILGLPIARVAERANRPYIISTAVGVWSFFTVICGFAQQFWHLVLARIGVGVGEAGCTPPAHSLIMDYTPPEKRSSALAFYGMGVPLGSLLGMAFGGIVADAYGWRVAFFIAGAPGLVLAILVVLTLKEPRERMRRQSQKLATSSVTFMDTLRVLAKKRSFVFLAAATALKAFISYGKAPFIASFFVRSHGDDVAVAASSLGKVFGVNLQTMGFLGIALGVIAGLGGVLGLWCGGRLADRLGTQDARRYMYIPAVGAFLSVPSFLAILMLPSLTLSLLFVGIHAFVTGLSYGPQYTAAFSVVPGHMRATTSAIMLFCINLIGLGLGPLIVGIGSDLLAVDQGSADGLKSSLMIAGFMGLVVTVLYILAARTIRADVHRE